MMFCSLKTREHPQNLLAIHSNSLKDNSSEMQINIAMIIAAYHTEIELYEKH